MSLCDHYCASRREYFFDRSPRIFENILGRTYQVSLDLNAFTLLGLYRKGELHLTESVCPRDFLGELEYWGLSALHLGESSLILKLKTIWLLQSLVAPTHYSVHPGCSPLLIMEWILRMKRTCSRGCVVPGSEELSGGWQRTQTPRVEPRCWWSWAPSSSSPPSSCSSSPQSQSSRWSMLLMFAMYVLIGRNVYILQELTTVTLEYKVIW